MLNNIVGLLTPAATVTVTGGTLYTSGGFNYRVFTANGTLGVAGGAGITADILVIAGGGGGGQAGDRGAGGGGAGGLLGFTSQSLTPANYSITVGSGGAGATSGGMKG